MDRMKARHWRRMSLRVLGAVGIGIALAGCIVVPLRGPRYYHPYYHYGY